MEKFMTFFAHAKTEIQKVIFPTSIQIRQAFIAVLIVVIVVALFLALVDLIMSNIVSAVL